MPIRIHLMHDTNDGCRVKFAGADLAALVRLRDLFPCAAPWTYSAPHMCDGNRALAADIEGFTIEQVRDVLSRDAFFEAVG